MARWDWYQATVWGSEDFIAADLARHYDLADLVPGRPKNGYDRAAEVRRGDEVLCTIMWGGNPGVNLMATGERAPKLREYLDRQEHYPSRVDACEDWIEPGLFDAMSGKLLAYAQRHGIKINQVGDWARGESRTLYLGSRQSPVQLVLYEKGCQLGLDPAWVRLEVRVRPTRADAKLRVSRWAPGHAFGASRWLTGAMQAIGWDHLQAQSVGTVRTPSDRDRERAALIRQYGRILSQWADDVGGWSDLGLILQSEISEHAF